MKTGITTNLIAVIDEAIDEGATSSEAYDRGVEYVKRQGLADELFSEVGRTIVSHLYHSFRATQPRPTRWDTPGRSRVEAAVVNTAMAVFRHYEAIVGKRRGDCTPDDVDTIIEHRRRLSIANNTAAIKWKRVRFEMTQRGAKSVYEAFRDNPEDLEMILRGVGDE